MEKLAVRAIKIAKESKRKASAYLKFIQHPHEKR